MKPIIVTTIFIGALLLGVMVSSADTMNIVNNVSVTSDSGYGGAASTGRATAHVHIEQYVNGVAEPSVDVTTSTASGSVLVHVYTKTISHGTSTIATSSIITDATPHLDHFSFFQVIQTSFENWLRLMFRF